MTVDDEVVGVDSARGWARGPLIDLLVVAWPGLGRSSVLQCGLQIPVTTRHSTYRRLRPFSRSIELGCIALGAAAATTLLMALDGVIPADKRPARG